MATSEVSCQQAGSDCWNCSQILGCHFCAFDKLCHAYGSVWGCTVGIDCQDVYDCIRKYSVYIGAGRPEWVAVFFGLMMALVTTCVFAFIWYCCCRSSNRGCCAKLSATEDVDDVLQLQEKSSLWSKDDDALFYQRYEDAPSGRPRGPELTRCARLRHRRGCRCLRRAARPGCLVMMCVMVVAVATVCILYYPQTPSYSICNKKVVWTSLFQGLAHDGQLTADLDLHLSLYNPSRFSIELEQIQGDLLYHDKHVATLRSKTSSSSNTPMELPAASITDWVLLAHFAPTAQQAVSMYEDHRAGSLLLDARFELRTQVSLFQRNLYALNTSYVVGKIDAEVPDARTFCKCPA